MRTMATRKPKRPKFRICWRCGRTQPSRVLVLSDRCDAWECRDVNDCEKARRPGTGARTTPLTRLQRKRLKRSRRVANLRERTQLERRASLVVDESTRTVEPPTLTSAPFEPVVNDIRQTPESWADVWSEDDDN